MQNHISLGRNGSGVMAELEGEGKTLPWERLLPDLRLLPVKPLEAKAASRALTSHRHMRARG